VSGPSWRTTSSKCQGWIAWRSQGRFGAGLQEAVAVGVLIVGDLDDAAGIEVHNVGGGERQIGAHVHRVGAGREGADLRS